MAQITVIGGGLAGVEAAWVAANRGVDVTLFEMRPQQMTGAHKTDLLAELVCSNSFKSKSPTSPAGQLKWEMEQLGSLTLPCAYLHEVPGGEALAIDRNLFSTEVTQKIESHPRIKLERRAVSPDDIASFLELGKVIIATGPLTSKPLANWLSEATGAEGLYFYDAVSPTVDASTIDRSIVFEQSRYDKGGNDYLNCPFEKDSYEAFVQELVSAERAAPHGMEMESEESLEKIKYFAGCTPIEAIAEKGVKSLAFGNFKPVGLTDPRTGRRPYAALQLRPENRDKTLYSLVACQNRLKWNEQKRVFRMVPGLESAEFVRFGVIHRNTYINSPRALTAQLELRDLQGVYAAGQITGVEGYVESAAMGILAGLVATEALMGRPIPDLPRPSALGSLISHLQDDTPREFSPMNINWGLFPPNEIRDKGLSRAQKLQSAQDALLTWMSRISQ